MSNVGLSPNHVNIETIAQACGGWLGYQKTRCPCCGGKMSISIGTKQPIVLWCWNTPPCNFRDIRSALVARSAWPSPCPARSSSQSRAAQRRPSLLNELRIDWRDIVDGAVDDHPRLARYLRSRGITGNYAPCLKLLPGVTAAKLGLGSHHHMVALLERARKLTGCQITELAVGAPGRMRHPSAKRSYGVVKGSCVLLGDHSVDAETVPLVIGEGCETTCSYLELHDGLPGVATLGAQNLFNVGIGTYQRVIILVDRDENGVGQASAERLQARLRRQGIGVELALPPIGMKDWNDACRVKK